MPIAQASLELWSSANDAALIDDVSTTGGARSTVARPTLDQFTANAVVALISDGTDTRNVTITGRTAAGAIATETLALTSAVEKLGAQVWERIHSVVAASADGARTITIRQGSGGTTRGTITPNETTRHIDFQRAASAAAGRAYYAKHFWRNGDGALQLNAATVTLTTDPSAKVKIALAAAKGDSATVANRLTSPGLTFSDDGVALSVPTGALAAGETIGMWTELTLASNDAPLKSSYTAQLAGTST
jgi:hypothetical protein